MLQNEKSSKLQCAVDVLREAILRGDLVPGQVLHYQQLADDMGMSRTPIREALAALEAEGLLERVARKGLFVSTMNPEESELIAQLRALMEGIAVRMSVPLLSTEDIANLKLLQIEMSDVWKSLDIAQFRRINFGFHSLLYRSSGSSTLCAIISRLWPRFATDFLWMIPGRAERSIQHHNAILEAICDRDAEAAGDIMSVHILTAGADIADFLIRQSPANTGQNTFDFSKH